MQSIDIEKFRKLTKEQDQDSVRWATMDSPAFGICEILKSRAKDDLVQEGINIDEVPESSLMYKKKCREVKSD